MSCSLIPNAHSPRLDIRSERTATGVTLHLAGEIDVATAPRLYDAAMDAARLNDPPDVTLDFADVDFCDSSGLNALVRSRKRIAAMRGRFALVHLPRRVLDMLNRTGLSRYFVILSNANFVAA